jgi:hypothetical protein
MQRQSKHWARAASATALIPTSAKSNTHTFLMPRSTAIADLDVEARFVAVPRSTVLPVR